MNVSFLYVHPVPANAWSLCYYEIQNNISDIKKLKLGLGSDSPTPISHHVLQSVIISVINIVVPGDSEPISKIKFSLV